MATVNTELPQVQAQANTVDSHPGKPETPARDADWIFVGTLESIARDGPKVVTGADRPIVVFAYQGRAFALDNRCPHMGFPLSMGSVRDGILTCHWHQARFDLCSGCTFDLFADDVPAFETRITGSDVHVRAKPIKNAGASRRQLVKGLIQNQALLQAKGLAALLSEGQGTIELAREIVQFSLGRNNRSQELIELTIGVNLSANLSPDTLYYVLFRGCRAISTAGVGVGRQPGEPLAGSGYSFETLRGWFNQWVLVRDLDAAERVLLTALAGGATPTAIADLLYGAETQRIYNLSGHSLDMITKALELLDHIGWQFAPKVLPGSLPIMFGRGAEEDGRWHQPVDLVALVRAAEGRLTDLLARPRVADWKAGPDLVPTLLGDDPVAIVAALEGALEAGAPPAELSRRVAYAGAVRLARFSAANEVVDWFNPQHSFIYANAVDQAVRRSPTPGVVRGLFHAAMAVYMDRYLNIPPARFPEESGSLDDLPTKMADLRTQLLESLDGRSKSRQAGRLVARHLALGHPEAALIDVLAFATVREDVDFHTLQVLEAGARQAAYWRGKPEASHIYVGVARSLAAVSPTPRARLKTATTAMRLHHGEQIFAETNA